MKIKFLLIATAIMLCMFNITYGVYIYDGAVSAILPNSFAAKNGIKIGDAVETRGGKVKGNSVLVNVDGHSLVIEKIVNVKIKSYMLYKYHYIIEW